MFVATFSYIQLSELEQRGVNEIAKVSKRHQVDSNSGPLNRQSDDLPPSRRAPSIVVAGEEFTSTLPVRRVAVLFASRLAVEARVVHQVKICYCKIGNVVQQSHTIFTTRCSTMSHKQGCGVGNTPSLAVSENSDYRCMQCLHTRTHR